MEQPLEPLGMDKPGARACTALPPGAVLSRKTTLEVRLACGDEDIQAAQRLRHRVFYRELCASDNAATSSLGRDLDGFDRHCDHLLVIDRGRAGDHGGLGLRGGKLVGTYRLLSQGEAERHGGFYTQMEFNIRALLARKTGLNFLELGRSCVLAEYRSKPVIELLWQGIWNYVRHHRYDVLFGCASFEGTDPTPHLEALAFLSRHAAAPREWSAKAHPHRYLGLDQMPGRPVDTKRALASLPPLIKGYLRLGAMIGDGFIIDWHFNTLDVFIILPVSHINPRYFSRFGPPSQVPRADFAE